jgi:hypothetical protein
LRASWLPMSKTDFSEILSQLRAEIESRLREELSGHSSAGKRILYDMVTPIYLNTIEDSQEFNLEFLAGGSVQLHTGLSTSPDVTVKGDLASLSDAVLKRSSQAFQEAERDGSIVVTCHTWKGQQAMKKVRELLASNL